VSTKKIDEMKDGVYTSFGQTDYSDARCSICKKKGHFVRTCPDKNKKKKKDKDDGLRGKKTSLGKTQGNPWANKDSDSGSDSSGPKGLVQVSNIS
jgi:Zinc knuckle